MTLPRYLDVVDFSRTLRPDIARHAGHSALRLVNSLGPLSVCLTSDLADVRDIHAAAGRTLAAGPFDPEIHGAGPRDDAAVLSVWDREIPVGVCASRLAWLEGPLSASFPQLFFGEHEHQMRLATRMRDEIADCPVAYTGAVWRAGQRPKDQPQLPKSLLPAMMRLLYLHIVSSWRFMLNLGIAEPHIAGHCAFGAYLYQEQHFAIVKPNAKGEQTSYALLIARKQFYRELIARPDFADPDVELAA